FEARRVDAVLADIGHHEPGDVLAVLADLLDEFDVPPVNIGEAAGVVIAVAAQRRQRNAADDRQADAAFAVLQVVPLMARDLARLAADADGRIGEEAHGVGHDWRPFRLAATRRGSRRTTSRSRAPLRVAAKRTFSRHTQTPSPRGLSRSD